MNDTADAENGGTPAHPRYNYVDASKWFVRRWVARPFRSMLGWIDTHNGLVTALATVGVAILTYFVAVYANGQLKVFGAQLEEMKSTGRQTDDLIETNKKLAEAAVQQARAAIEANRIAQRSQIALIEAQRANMAYKMVNLSITTENGVRLEHWLPVWVNNGNSPAINLRLRARCVTGGQKSDVPFDLSSAHEPPRTSATAREEPIGPGCHVQEGIVDAARRGDGFFSFFGDARYVDIYGVEHLTEFCGRLPGNVANSEKTSLSACSKHNCSDGDCENYPK